MSGVTVESHQGNGCHIAVTVCVYMYSTGCFLVSKVTTDGLEWQIFVEDPATDVIETR